MEDNKSFKLVIGNKDKSRWRELLDEIDKGNVIPVLGPDLLTEPKVIDPATGRVENLHQQIISFIAARTNVESKPRTFSQLVYDEHYRLAVNSNTKEIYSLITQILDNLEIIDEIDGNPSKMLMDLLGTRKFPFVITTSFTPVVENAMRKIWGDVNVMKFTNNPSDSKPECGGDILTDEDLMRPTVYYMYGKYCDNHEKYVVTDSNMMKFCSAWLKGDGVPKNLYEILKRKYLLILGNNYSDWLFRFVWYGLRDTTDDMKSDYVVKEMPEDAFKQFLERLETFFQENPAEVIQRIKEDMEARTLKKTAKSYKHDVFISYSRTDSEIATNLYNALKALKLNVWFDNTSIEKAADWEDSITRGIQDSRLFVPILTKNVEKEAIVPHEYRSEWNIASNLSLKMGGRTFIIPFAENGFDFYSKLTKLPQAFLKKNATWFTSSDDTKEIAEVILKEIDRLKQIESILK